jgi:hypothetical protein
MPEMLRKLDATMWSAVAKSRRDDDTALARTVQAATAGEIKSGVAVPARRDSAAALHKAPRPDERDEGDRKQAFIILGIRHLALSVRKRTDKQ